MSPSLKYLIVLSMAARKSSLRADVVDGYLRRGGRDGGGVGGHVVGCSGRDGWARAVVCRLLLCDGVTVTRDRRFPKPARPLASSRLDPGTTSMLRGPRSRGQRGCRSRTCHDLARERACERTGGAERRAGAGDGRGRAAAGRRGRVAAREPPLVGRRRRRLPGRTRRRHRRGRLRVVPGGPAGGGRPAARRRRGRRVLEVGAGSAPCARWLAGQGARPVALDLSAGMLRHAAALGRAHRASSCRSCRPTPRSCRSRDGSFDLACSAFGAVPFVAEPEPGDARGGPGAAARRPVGVRGEPPDALDVLRRPRPGRAGRAAVLLRPHALRRGGRRRAPPPTSSTTARSATGCATSSPRGWCWTDVVEPEWPEGRETVWGQWSPLRGALFPGTAIFCCRKPG